MAAAGSLTGGSALIIKLALQGRFEIASSSLLLEEAKRNIEDHFGPAALSRHLADVAALEIHMVEDASLTEEEERDGVVPPKDRHVLAGAIKAKADVLVTLDRKHLLTDAVRHSFPVRVMDTRTFFVEFLVDESTD